MSKPAVDYSLYLVTDSGLNHPSRTLLQSVEDSILGGVTLVQLREKDLDTPAFIELARKVHAVTKKVPFHRGNAIMPFRFHLPANMQLEVLSIGIDRITPCPCFSQLAMTKEGAQDQGPSRRYIYKRDRKTKKENEMGKDETVIAI